ncbi:Transposon Ty3-G Gag-Pol poly, partial [Paramuricea clavata]
MVDGHSGYPFVQQLKSLQSKAIIRTLNNWFLDWGFPKYLKSDGGPQFRSEFQSYCKEKGITHEISSPYHPRSNGLAESNVKNLKHLLLKCDGWDEFRTALSEWRNVPREDGTSPAQLLLRKRQRGLLPAIESRAIPDTNEPDNCEKIRKRNELKQARITKRNITLTELRPLGIGEKVLVQDPTTARWNTEGVIVNIRKHGRSYNVETTGGWTMLRNRR